MKKICLFVILIFSRSILSAQNAQADSLFATLQKAQNHYSYNSKADTLFWNQIFSTILYSDFTEPELLLIEKKYLPVLQNNEYLEFSLLFNLLESRINRKYFEDAIRFGERYCALFETNKKKYYHSAHLSFLQSIRVAYRNSKYLKEGFNYFAKKIEKYTKEGDSTIVSISYFVLSGFYRTIGLNEYAIYNLKKANSYLDTNKIYSRISAFEGNSLLGRQGYSNHLAVLGDSYNLTGNYNLSIEYSYRALQKRIEDTSIAARVNNSYVAANLAESYLKLQQIDSVNYFLSIANKALQEIPDASNQAKILQIEANFLLIKKDYSAAEDTLLKLKQLIEREKLPYVSTAGNLTPDYYLASGKFEQGKYKEAILLLESELMSLNVLRAEALRDYKLLATCYTKIGNANQALIILNKYITLQDSLKFDESKYRSIGFEIEEQLKHNEISIDKLKNESKTASVSRNYLIGIAGLLCLLALGMYSRFKSKKKDNEILSAQKSQIENTLEQLKATQSQLIQSEKMASLGELTAGIAHEIQNPLNFVNNFSEVSKELLDEMNVEIEKGNFDETKLLASDIKQNLDKIHHHGKRADAIVKGMLQHSRTNTSQKEPTLVNAMANEFLRLSYHGFRAKDKSFNASIKTDFDERIGKVNIAAQDIGRVILNLVNNAFYAINDRKKLGDANYAPEVIVRTKLLNNSIEIRVSDNGNGIPEAIVDKIFQPFFTTKPAGQGTGLGLSLSYDIIKSHGGELQVTTKEGEGSEFILKLPIDN